MLTRPKRAPMTYRIAGLDPAPYKPLFRLSDAELEERGIVRMNVTKKPSFPCRISLADRDVGETVLLVNHVSHDVANPFRASHAIFVTEGVDEAAEFIDQIPTAFLTRMLSLRGFDEDGMMVDALVAEPGEAEAGILQLFGNSTIRTVHAHNAARGCFFAKIERY
jgi:hypothetical protein